MSFISNCLLTSQKKNKFQVKFSISNSNLGKISSKTRKTSAKKAGTSNIHLQLEHWLTLHIGATRTTPSQSCGAFRLALRATAPPMDCPNKKQGNPLTSGLPTISKKIDQQLLLNIKGSHFRTPQITNCTLKG